MQYPRTETAISLLKDARDRILFPENWCKGSLGFDSNGKPTDGAHIDTQKWCALGSILKSLHDKCPSKNDDVPRMSIVSWCELDSPDRQLGMEVYFLLRGAIEGERNIAMKRNTVDDVLTEINDDLGHGAVMGFFDTVIHVPR